VGAAQDHRVEQIRVERLLFGRSAGAWLGGDGLSPHRLHEALHPLMVNLQAKSSHMGGHSRPAGKGRLGIWLVNESHQPQVLLGFRRGRSIERRTVSPEQVTLTANADVGNVHVDHQPLGLS
jgi:hypothetical protein